MNKKLIMQRYLSKIISNSCFEKNSPLQMELQIQLFLHQNETIIRSHLSSAPFFPDLSWTEIKKLFLTTLREMSNVIFLPGFYNTINIKINFTVFNTLNEKTYYQEEYSSQLFEFISSAVQKKEYRQKIDGVLSLINQRIIEKYLNPYQLTFSLNFPAPLLGNYLKTLLLIYPIVFIESKEQFLSSEKINPLVEKYQPRLTLFPENLLQEALFTAVNRQADPPPPLTSQLAKIFFDFSRLFQFSNTPNQGALPPQQSWFQIQTKNSQFFGYNPELLSQLHQIAEKNGW